MRKLLNNCHKLLTRGKLKAHPNREGHDTMVDYMKSWYMLIFFAQNKKELERMNESKIRQSSKHKCGTIT